MKIGFIGLGEMGGPMAKNLAKSDAALTVCDIDKTLLNDFRHLSIHVTSDQTDLHDSEILFCCLPDGAIVEKVFKGENGLLEKMQPGSLLVDLSTIKYRTAIEMYESCAGRGIDYLDAPVSGMLSRAIDGTLAIMCGGSPEAFQRAEPFLQLLGKTILYMGPAGSGQLMKLVNNLLFDINAAAIAEILPFASHMGLDPENVVEVVNHGTGRSYASEFFAPLILEGDFTRGYPMHKAYKDLVSGQDIAMEEGIPLPVLSAAIATYQTALRQGYGDYGKGVMIRVFEELLGVEFRRREKAENNTDEL